MDDENKLFEKDDKRICKNCGKTIDFDNYGFCPYCGAILNEEKGSTIDKINYTVNSGQIPKTKATIIYIISNILILPLIIAYILSSAGHINKIYETPLFITLLACIIISLSCEMYINRNNKNMLLLNLLFLVMAILLLAYTIVSIFILKILVK